MKKIILGSILILMGCNQFSPFIDARREAGQIELVGQSTSDKVAVCYNPIWSDEEILEKLAIQECAKTDRKPVYSETKWFSCRLITPATAFYDCKKS